MAPFAASVSGINIAWDQDDSRDVIYVSAALMVEVPVAKGLPHPVASPCARRTVNTGRNSVCL
jgi:hypothetical protein